MYPIQSHLAPWCGLGELRGGNFLFAVARGEGGEGMWQTVEGCATGSVDFFPLDFIFISRALVFCLRACLCEGGTGVADRREPSGLLGIESRASGSAASALNH